MPSDPQLLSEILAGPPEEADYDALYADFMATPRGRWFLTEYAGRNRFADTHLLAGAIARVEAAVRGEPVPQVPAAVAREIADLAVAIGRIEDEFAAPPRLASEGFSAAERLQDVAFALREREVDAEMSDVLEAAIRELGEIFARGDAAAERAQNALALLRELKGRVHAMVADAVVGAGVSPVAVTEGETLSDAVTDDGFGEEGDIPDALLAERSAADAQADEHFAAMIGALAASFPAADEPPAPDEAGEPAAVPLGEFADALSPAAEPEAAFESAAEPVGDEKAAAAEPELEPADVESEDVTPPAVPEPGEHEPAVIQQLDTEELAEEERAAEPTASEPAAVEDLAAESLADQSLAAVEPPDAGDQKAAALVASGAIEAGSTPSEHETPPTTPESPAADIAELPGAGEVVPPHLPDEPSISPADLGPADLPATDLSAGDLPAADLPAQDLPAQDLPAQDLPAQDLPAQDLPAQELPAHDLPAQDLPAADLAEAAVAEAASGLEKGSVPSELEPEENAALARDETEIVPDDARQADATADYILGSGIAPGGEGVERFDHTVKESISEPIQTPAAAEPTATVLKETETTQQLLPDLQAAPGPEEDPADLFEPLPMPSPVPTPQTVPGALQSTGAAPASGGAMSLFDTPIAYDGGAAGPSRAGAVELQDDARSPAAAAQIDHAVPAASPAAAAAPSPQMRLPLESSTPQPQPRPAAPMMRGIPRPAPSDPLASLSEEELIALFS